MVRQARFNPDGSITDVPTRETERPQLEKQGDIFQYAADNHNLAIINGKGEPGNVSKAPTNQEPSRS